jgi:hypothetical protein
LVKNSQALRHENGYRLVTTNADRRFLGNKPYLKSSAVHCAPRLSPPRPGEWRSPVFLHGLIDEDEDPEGKHLIFTSSDFGKAYLRDAWAARFVVELFREFTIIFIGYSVNDPVMGYLIDALAADTDSGRFKKAFALAGYTSGMQKEEEIAWEAKGITLIPFDAGPDPDKPDFTKHDRTLIEWARFNSSPSSERAQWAIRIASTHYVPGGQQAEDTAHYLAWLLSQPDGGVSKAFSRASPAPDISWLPILSEETIEIRGWDKKASLVNFPEQSPETKLFEKRGALVASSSHSVDLQLKLSPVSRQIVVWLSKHLDKKELVDWVISLGSTLHPEFASQIQHQLIQNESKLTAPFKLFWNLILTVSQTPPGWLSNDAVWQVGRIIGKHEPSIREKAVFLRSLYPCYFFKSSSAVRWAMMKKDQAGKTTIENLYDLVDVEIGLTDDHFIHDLVRRDQEDWKSLAGMVDELTSLLAQAVSMGVDANFIGIANGRSNFNWPSVSPHTQNRNRHNWSSLGELCRQAFEQVCQTLPTTAQAIVDRWSMLSQKDGYGVFSRLTIHAYTVWTKLPTGKALDMLLYENTLWESEYHREVCRFLVLRGANLTTAQLGRLTKALLKGLPRTMFRDDLDEDDFKHYREHGINLKLAKLLESGALLRGEPQKRGDTYQKALSEKDRREERDEFRSWMGEVYTVPPSTANDLIDQSPSKIVDVLIKPQDRFSSGQALADLLKRDRKKGIAVLSLLAEKNLFQGELWNIGIRGLDDAIKKDSTSIITEIWDLANNYPQITSNGLDGLASCVKGIAKSIEGISEIEEFWKLWDISWNQAKTDGESSLISNKHNVSWAINHPGGDLAEALLDRLWKREYKPGTKLPKELTERFNEMTTGDTEAHHAARILFVSRLVWLNAIDPDWCQRHLIKRMTWQKGERGHVF